MRRVHVMLFVVALVAVRWSAVPALAESGPVALWHMDETSGSVMRDAVGDHDGVLHSVVVGRPGFSGTAYGFMGSAKVTVPSSSDLNPGSEDMSLSIHLRSTQVPSSGDWDVMRKGTESSSGGDWKMEYQASGQISCGFLGSKGAELIAGPALNDGHWHTVQCVKTSSDIEVVVDGTIHKKDAKVGSLSNSAPVVIASHGTAEYFQGDLDEASIQIGPGSQPQPK